MAIAKIPAIVTMPKAPQPHPSILDFLVARFPRIDRSTWLKRIADKKILDKDKQPISLATPYAPLQRLYYFREVENEPDIPFQEEILYQDDHFLVADKPHFLPTTQGGRFIEQSLIYRLRERTGNDAIAPIHRLDRETAGIVMFSLNPKTRGKYALLFENRLVQKLYHAISPHLPNDTTRSWTVENRLVQGIPPFRIQTEDGEINARSQIDCIESREGKSYFHLHPKTGKKHQLRHHMASIGFPIENDKYYPNLQDESPDNYATPLQLLAKEIRFTDPITQEHRHFISQQSLQW